MAQAPSVEQWEQARGILVDSLTSGGMDPAEAQDLAEHSLLEAGYPRPDSGTGPAPSISQQLE